jgi:hypothetical protein
MVQNVLDTIAKRRPTCQLRFSRRAQSFLVKRPKCARGGTHGRLLGEGMPERGRLVRPVLPIEKACRKESNPFGHGLEVGGRAARAPASPTFSCLLKSDILSQRADRPFPWLDGHIASGALPFALNRVDKKRLHPTA